MNVRPITPEMRNILQSLVNNRDHFRRQLLDAEKQFTDYIQQCGQLLGLKDDEIEGFDIAAAAFLLKDQSPEQTYIDPGTDHLVAIGAFRKAESNGQ